MATCRLEAGIIGVLQLILRDMRDAMHGPDRQILIEHLSAILPAGRKLELPPEMGKTIVAELWINNHGLRLHDPGRPCGIVQDEHRLALLAAPGAVSHDLLGPGLLSPLPLGEG